MEKTNAQDHNPALNDLEGLVGEWEMELSNAVFLPNPATTVKGPVSFEWVEKGAFLCMRMGDNALWLINRDDASPEYKVFYFDARSVSRIYEMSFSEHAWNIWREAPGFSQRFIGNLSEDRKIITGTWEKSSDGVIWEHDFNVTYTKIR